MVIITHVNDFLTDQLAKRVTHLQKALNQAERIVNILEEENQRLKDVLSNLTSENNEGYILDSEAFNEPMLTV
jgi:ABC-type transporter Mla subunit MlaD